MGLIIPPPPTKGPKVPHAAGTPGQEKKNVFSGNGHDGQRSPSRTLRIFLVIVQRNSAPEAGPAGSRMGSLLCLYTARAPPPRPECQSESAQSLSETSQLQNQRQLPSPHLLLLIKVSERNQGSVLTLCSLPSERMGWGSA